MKQWNSDAALFFYVPSDQVWYKFQLSIITKTNESYLRRHNPLPLLNQPALGTSATLVHTLFLVPPQNGNNPVIPTPRTFRNPGGPILRQHLSKRITRCTHTKPLSYKKIHKIQVLRSRQSKSRISGSPCIG